MSSIWFKSSLLVPTRTRRDFLLLNAARAWQYCGGWACLWIHINIVKPPCRGSRNYTHQQQPPPPSLVVPAASNVLKQDYLAGCRESLPLLTALGAPLPSGAPHLAEVSEKPNKPWSASSSTLPLSSQRPPGGCPATPAPHTRMFG